MLERPPAVVHRNARRTRIRVQLEQRPLHARPLGHVARGLHNGERFLHPRLGLGNAAEVRQRETHRHKRAHLDVGPLGGACVRQRFAEVPQRKVHVALEHREHAQPTLYAREPGVVPGSPQRLARPDP